MSTDILDRPRSRKGTGQWGGNKAPGQGFKPGVSGNPGGRSKLTDEERDWIAEANAKMRRDHPDNTDWLIATRGNDEAPWEVRTRVAIHLDNKIRPDPPRLIAAAHAHLDAGDLDLKNDGSVEDLADAYAALIGAQSDEEAYRYARMINVTPSPSRSLPPPSRYDRDRERQAEIDELREMAAEEAAERRERPRRPKQGSTVERARRPKQPERARRPRSD